MSSLTSSLSGSRVEWSPVRSARSSSSQISSRHAPPSPVSVHSASASAKSAPAREETKDSSIGQQDDDSYADDHHSEHESSKVSLSAADQSAASQVSPSSPSETGSSLLGSSQSFRDVSAKASARPAPALARDGRRPVSTAVPPPPPPTAEASVNCTIPREFGIQCDGPGPFGEPVDPLMVWASLGAQTLSLPSSMAASKTRLAIAGFPYHSSGLLPRAAPSPFGIPPFLPPQYGQQQLLQQQLQQQQLLQQQLIQQQLVQQQLVQQQLLQGQLLQMQHPAAFQPQYNWPY